MKKFGVLLLLIVMFFSPMISVVSTPVVYAQENNDGAIANQGATAATSTETEKRIWEVFPNAGEDGQQDSSGNWYSYIVSPTAVSIFSGKTSSGSNWQPTASQMKFTVQINLDEPVGQVAQDSGSQAGILDEDDNLGDWGVILDATPDNDTNSGIFLFLEKKNASGTWDAVPHESYKLISKTGDELTTDHAVGDSFDVAAGGDVAAVYNTDTFEGKGLGYYLYRVSPQEFFGKKGKIMQVAVDGLQANTTYRAGVILDENELLTSKRAVTDPTKNVVFTTLATGATNPNNEEITANLESTGSTEGNTAAEANTIFGQEVKCEATSPTTWFSGCLLYLYHIIYQVSSQILRIAAGFMDIFMAYSLSDYMYRNGFIETGWSVVRDVCNMLFIFILLWTAFKMVINDHHFNAKQVITNILIIGIFINFSLFFSKVVIDLGNISARVFYNQIRIQGSAQDDVTAAVDSEQLGIKPIAISEAIANGIGFGQIDSTGYQKMNESNEGGLSYGVLFLLITLGIFLNLFAAFILVKVSFAFLGRILSLWMAMVFSPFAFTSTILSGGHGHGGPLDIQKIGWHDWLKNLLNAAFYPAIFLFFLLLITILIKDSFLQNAILANDNLTGTAWIVTFLLNAAFLLGLLKVAGDMGSKMAGTFGEELAALAGKAAGFVGGAAIGVATGGMALAGQRFMGARANAALNGVEGENLRKTATSSLETLRADHTGKTDAQLLKMQQQAKNKLVKLDTRKNASYDIRNTQAGQVLSSATGLNFNAGIGNTKLGVNSTAGGWQAMKDRKAWKENEKEEKFKKILGDQKIIIKNGDTETIISDQQAKTIKEKIADHEEDLKNNSDLKELAKQLEKIDQDIRDAKNSGDTTLTATKVAERKNVQEELDTGKKNLNEDFKKQMNTQFANVGFENPKKKISDILVDVEKATKKAKDGYAKDYMRNHVYHNLRNENRSRFNDTDNLARIAATMGTGALAGATVAGPLGAVVGTVAGALGGGRLSVIQNILRDIDRKFSSDLSGRTSYNAATHDVEAGHVHQPHAHASYHTPHGSWFGNMFKGGSGGGGSHGGGGHGGGHDDHGGHH